MSEPLYNVPLSLTEMKLILAAFQTTIEELDKYEKKAGFKPKSTLTFVRRAMESTMAEIQDDKLRPVTYRYGGTLQIV